MSIYCLLDNKSSAKYILVYGGERVRFMHLQDLCTYCDERFGQDCYCLQFEYAEEWI